MVDISNKEYSRKDLGVVATYTEIVDVEIRLRVESSQDIEEGSTHYRWVEEDDDGGWGSSEWFDSLEEATADARKRAHERDGKRRGDFFMDDAHST